MIQIPVDLRANSVKVSAFVVWEVCVCFKTEDSNTIFESIRDVSDDAHLVKSDRWTY